MKDFCLRHMSLTRRRVSVKELRKRLLRKRMARRLSRCLGVHGIGIRKSNTQEGWSTCVLEVENRI